MIEEAEAKLDPFFVSSRFLRVGFYEDVTHRWSEHCRFGPAFGPLPSKWVEVTYSKKRITSATSSMEPGTVRKSKNLQTSITKERKLRAEEKLILEY